MKTFWAVVVIVIVLAGGAYALVKHNNNNNKASAPTTSASASTTKTPSASTNVNPTATTSVQSDKVMIASFAFSPSNITIKKGATVTWTNNDSVAHTVTENDGQTGPKSGDLSQGQSYSFTYKTAGTFKYHCSIHPEMTGTVTVTD